MPERIDDLLSSATRPLVTIILVIGLTWGFAVRLIDGAVYATIVTAVIGYWFGKRDGERAQEAAATQAADRVVAQVAERRGRRKA